VVLMAWLMAMVQAVAMPKVQAAAALTTPA